MDSENVRWGKVRVKLSLTSKSLFFERVSDKKLLGSTNLDCVIGAARKSDTNPKNRSEVVLEVYRYPFPNTFITRCLNESKYRAADHFLFSFYDKNECDNFVERINSIVRSSSYFNQSSSAPKLLDPERVRKFLVVINPKAGTGSSVNLWQKTVKPFLIEAGIESKAFITEGPNHAYMYILSFDWEVYDAVLTIGGDGTLAEVVEGLCNREDGEKALERLVLIPFGGGSGNGLIKSVMFASNEEYSFTNVLFGAVKGKPQPVDLSLVATATKQRHAFLMLAWGLTADIDLLSESMRYLGVARLHIAALYFVLKNKTYLGRLSILQTSAVREAPDSIPAHGSPLPPYWTTIEGEFSTVFVLQTSHVTTTMHASPGSKLDDGVLSIHVIKKVSCFQLLGLLLAFDSGDYIKSPLVSVYKAYAYRLEPLTSDGRFSLDGENVEYGPIQGHLQKKGITSFRYGAPSSKEDV